MASGQFGGYTAPTMTTPLGFAETLRRWRRDKDIKQDHLAQLCGVNQATISRWERGSHLPSPSQRSRLDALMCSDGRHAATRLDAVLKRLVNGSGQPVHLICDQTHRLYAASRPRAVEWRNNTDSLLNLPLWRFATQTIRIMEGRLDSLGWWEGQGCDAVMFETEGITHPELIIQPGWMMWERLILPDQPPVRLVTSITATDAVNLQNVVRLTA